MKNLKILAIFALLALCASPISSQVVPQGRTRLKVQECTKLNKTIRDPLNTALQGWVKSIEGNGFIKFNMEKMQNNHDLQLIRPLLGMTAPSTFVETGKSESPANEDITFVTAQQYHNGILVEGGGYTQGYIGCVTFFLNAYIFEDINISLTPSQTKQQAITAVQSYESGTTVSISENNVQLVIDQNLKESCDYVLAWKLDYNKGGLQKSAYVNASNGTVYREVSRSREINAPTVDYGTVNLDDQLNFVGTFRYLKTNDYSVITFDKTGIDKDSYLGATNNFDIDFEERIPASLTEWPITGSDGHEPEVYQAHHVVSNARNVLAPFGLNFPGNIYVAGNVNFSGAGYSSFVSPSGAAQKAVRFGWYEDDDGDKQSLALLDVAGHELTHMHLDGKFDSDGEPGGIEEAICDIFGEHAERNSPGGMDDWIAGGQNGSNVRNLTSPVIPSYYPSIGDEDDVHEIAGPMERWYTILVDGGTFNLGWKSYVVPSMDKNEAAFLVLTAINYMGGSSDYFDARAATIAAAEEIYGECSDEVEAVATAWYAVNVGYPDYCKIVVFGPIVYCEEYLGTQGGNVDLTVVNPVLGYTYKWTFPYDWHAINESGPQTFFGQHLQIYQYSSMPNFPRYYSITVKEYDQSNNFLKYKNLTITIKDCDGDDPSNPCGGNLPAFLTGYASGNNGVEIAQSAMHSQVKASINGSGILLPENYDPSLEYEFSIYDISGRRVQYGKLDGNFQPLELPNSGMYIYHVQDGQHKTVEVGKISFVKD